MEAHIMQNTLQNTQHDETLSDLQKNIFENGIFCDCTIVCNGSEIRVHKCILSNASEFFERILIDNSFQDNIKIVMSPEFEFNTIFRLMEFIYLGSTQISKADCDDFYEACEILQIKNIAPLAEIDALETHKHGQEEVFEVVNIPVDDRAGAVTVADENLTSVESHHVEDQESETQYYVDEDFHEPEQEHDEDVIEEEQPQHRIVVVENNEDLNLQYIQHSVDLEPEENLIDQTTEILLRESLMDSPKKNNDELETEPVNEEPPPSKIRRVNPPVVRILSSNKQRSSVQNNTTAALNAMIKDGLSLRHAAEEYGIPKTELYLRFKEFKNKNRAQLMPIPSPQVQAMRAIERGESVKDVFSKYNLPMSDIVKMKQRCVEQQNVIPMAKERPTTSVRLAVTKPTPPSDAASKLQALQQKANEYKVHLQKAINACRVGMSLDEASMMFSIPAATLYRNIKHMKLAHIHEPSSQ